MLILPKASAQRLVEARDEAGRTAAVLEGAAYLNGSLISFWPGEFKESPGGSDAPASGTPPSVAPSCLPALHRLLQCAGEDSRRNIATTFARMLKELDSQAHFVPYAPPSFIAFRGGEYLQIPIATTLAASDSGSQYKLAALAFDRHVAHLIRPVLAYFKDSTDFTGIDFSTTVRLAGASRGEAAKRWNLYFP